ncbi:hypothetical protein [Embleya sp. NPDC050493]|uniref:hypothetical protein n=1 Tax=Embleya sp. NPDC050493 TaxID=3363989 RepID=UPI0037B685E8
MDAVLLPHVLWADNLERARVIKIDVEGAEASLMRGFAPVLGRLRADVELVIEVTYLPPLGQAEPGHRGGPRSAARARLSPLQADQR